MDEDPAPPSWQSGEPADASSRPGLPRYEPAPHETEPPSHPDLPGPLGVVGTLGIALRLWGRDLLATWVGVAAVMIPIAAISFALQDASVPRSATLYHGNIYLASGTSDGTFAGLQLLDELLQYIGFFLMTGVIYRILLGRYLHHPASLAVSFAFARERFAKLFVITVLTAVLTVIGFIILIIPGIYVYVVLSVVIPVAMAENHGIGASLERSRELVRDLWWHCFGLVLAQLVVAVGISYLLGLVITRALIHSSSSLSLYFLLTAAVEVVLTLITGPFVAAVSIVLYVDLLLRKRDPQLPALLA